ncbi:MAG: ABC transporter ATP-binding protein [Chloroflexi bacterium]|nr:ABC transporter ATP-binding protein [Chloroflexota bacterium]
MTDIDTGPRAASLEAKELVFQVEGRRLLDRISLKAAKGEFVGLVGPNGAGKTTFLKALLRLLRTDEGVVLLEGRDLQFADAREAAQAMALVPQAVPNTFGFTSLEVVLMGRYPHLSRFQVEGAEDRRIAREALKLTETDGFADRILSTLSGGERQRVIVARAVAQQPRVLLMDEPISNLDVQHQTKVLDVVRDLVRQGITAIAAMHDLSLAARYCDRLLMIGNGRVAAEGTPEGVLTPANLKQVFGVEAVVFREPFADRLSISLMDMLPDAGDSPKCRVHLVCGSGSGVRLMCQLQRAGHSVSAGVLGAGDTDCMAAQLLNVPFIPIPAFSSISDEAHRLHLELIVSADYAVLCDVPFGVNNLRNLEALLSAKSTISIEATPFGQRDFTSGAAAKIFDSLPVAERCSRVDQVSGIIQDRLKKQH